MKLKNRNQLVIIIFGIIILLIGILMAITFGAVKISLQDIINSFLYFEETLEMMLVRDVRVPRVICVLLTGGVLGITGAMMQGVTRNPIAEPSLLGISQGATLVIAIFYATGAAITINSVIIASFLGAFISGGFVIAFMMKKMEHMAVGKLLLAGTAISTFFISLTTIIGLVSNRSQLIAFWVSGGFRNASWSDVILISIVAGIGFVFSIVLSPKINILNLGDAAAIGLGENPVKVRLITLLCIIPMCAAAVVVGKNISFVGLIIPQVVRMMVGEDYRRIIPYSFLLGAILLTYADIAARMLFSPYETPIGIFTALFGIPFFIGLARKERG